MKHSKHFMMGMMFTIMYLMVLAHHHAKQEQRMDIWDYRHRHDNYEKERAALIGSAWGMLLYCIIVLICLYIFRA